MKKASFFSIVLLAGLLVSCTLPVRNIPPPAVLRLDPLETTPRRAGAPDGIVVVAAPSMVTELDTYRIALKKGAQGWDYYAGARWPDFLPVVVQADLTRTLERSRQFKAVTADDSGLSGDRILKTEIQAFQAGYAAGHTLPVIKIRMAVSLVGRLDGAVLDSFTIEAGKKAAGNTLSAIQAAFAAAFSDAQRQLVKKLGEVNK